MPDGKIDRRYFLKQATAAGMGLGLAGYWSASARAASAPTVGANDRLTVAVCGTNGRGLAHIDCLATLPGVEIKYICDVDTHVFRLYALTTAEIKIVKGVST